MMAKNYYPFLFSLLALSILFGCGQPDSSGIYNVAKDDHDPNDAKFVPSSDLSSLPSKVNLRDTLVTGFQSPFAQGDLNSCTANAISAAIYFDMVKQRWTTPFTPSRLFIYYNERRIEGRLDESKYGKRGAPAKLRDCIKTVHNQGFCSAELWPYDESKFDNQPPQEAYDAAQQHQTYKYERLQTDLSHLKSCLTEGYPFVFGFDVYESFESPGTKKTGMVPMPENGERKIGGHAVAAVGYDDEKEAFIFLNSFGPFWGQNGYGHMPYQYLEKYAFDFWVVTKIN